MEYFIATRPWSFTASMMPILMANTLAAQQDPSSFSWVTLLLTVVGILAIHAAGNLSNTYWDFISGNDKKETSGDRTLFDLHLKPNDILRFALLCYLVSAIIGVFVLYEWGRQLFWLLLCGFLLAFFYTAQPIRLKARALGDAVIFFCFGPGPAIGVYFMQTVTWSVLPLLFSVPMGLLSVAILHANNTRDIKADKAAGLTTVAILLGQSNSFGYYATLFFVSYIWVFGIAASFSYYLFLVSLSIPVALQLLSSFKKGSLAELTERTAQFHLLFGLLFVVSLVLKLVLG